MIDDSKRVGRNVGLEERYGDAHVDRMEEKGVNYLEGPPFSLLFCDG